MASSFESFFAPLAFVLAFVVICHYLPWEPTSGLERVPLHISRPPEKQNLDKDKQHLLSMTAHDDR